MGYAFRVAKVGKKKKQKKKQTKKHYYYYVNALKKIRAIAGLVFAKIQVDLLQSP